ncbi:GIY-YIG nuclease family protein [Candidatus Neomarinimicrobiota bacterium]
MKKYYVYIIELDSRVADFQRFREKNPQYIKGNGCVYVGQSSKEPSLRFEQHKEGYKSNKYAKIYGIRLRPDLYEKYNPIPTRKDAEEIEEILGKELRKKGIGVWFN